MKKISSLFALALTVALPTMASAQQPATAGAVATPGKPLFSGDGKRIGAVYRVLPDGSPQLIVLGKLVTVPVATVTVDEGKVTTTLTKKQLTTAR